MAGTSARIKCDRFRLDLSRKFTGPYISMFKLYSSLYPNETLCELDISVVAVKFSTSAITRKACTPLFNLIDSKRGNRKIKSGCSIRRSEQNVISSSST